MGTTAAVTVTVAATLIVPANTRRQSLYLINNGLERCFLGETSAVTDADGFILEESSQISEDRGMNIYKGPYYGIVSANTTEIRYWERTQY